MQRGVDKNPNRRPNPSMSRHAGDAADWLNRAKRAKGGSTALGKRSAGKGGPSRKRRKQKALFSKRLECSEEQQAIVDKACRLEIGYSPGPLKPTVVSACAGAGAYYARATGPSSLPMTARIVCAVSVAHALCQHLRVAKLRLECATAGGGSGRRGDCVCVCVCVCVWRGGGGTPA